MRRSEPYVEETLDQPDYDRRLRAFNAVSHERDEPFTAEQWRPLLHNLTFYLQQDEEFGILASNSADGICKFVEATKSVMEQPGGDAFTELLSNIILPALYAGSRDESERVRREILRVFGFLVETLGSSWPPVRDLNSPRADRK